MVLRGGSYNAILLAISFNNSGITAWMVYAQKRVNISISIFIYVYEYTQYTQKFITATSLTALTVPGERYWH